MRIILIISSLLVAFVSGLLTLYLKDGAIYENIVVGILSSSLVVFVLEIAAWLKNRHGTKYLPGTYHRNFICEVDHSVASGSRYKDMTPDYIQSKVTREVTIRRSKCWSEFHFKGDVEYKEHGRSVSFQLAVNESNFGLGSGIFQYEKNNSEGRNVMGTYALTRNHLDPNKLVIYYQDITDNGLAEGYEIWVKQRK